MIRVLWLPEAVVHDGQRVYRSLVVEALFGARNGHDACKGSSNLGVV